MTEPTIPLNLTPESSQIRGWGYHAPSQTLAVEYRSNHKELTYHYRDVSPAQAAALEAANSKGRFIFNEIKAKHEFDRLAKPVEPEAQAASESAADVGVAQA